MSINVWPCWTLCHTYCEVRRGKCVAVLLLIEIWYKNVCLTSGSEWTTKHSWVKNTSLTGKIPQGRQQSLKSVTAETLQKMTKELSWNVSWLKSMWKKRTVEMAHYTRGSSTLSVRIHAIITSSGHQSPFSSNLALTTAFSTMSAQNFLHSDETKKTKSREKRQKSDYI